MGGGNFSLLAVAEADGHHGIRNGQHLTDAPLQRSGMAHNATLFHCHCFLPFTTQTKWNGVEESFYYR